MNEPKQMHSKLVLNDLHRALQDPGSLKKLSSMVSQGRRMPTRGQLHKEELSNVRGNGCCLKGKMGPFS